MTDQYTGRARITNKQTGASREGVVMRHRGAGFDLLEKGATTEHFYWNSDFTIDPILPEIPSEPGDTFTAEVTRNGRTKRVLILVDEDRDYRSNAEVDGYDLHYAEHIDRATIESVITAKERGL